MAFVRQNYQILGWMWLPTALYGVSSEQWALASFAWFAAVFGITPSSLVYYDHNVANERKLVAYCRIITALVLTDQFSHC